MPAADAPPTQPQDRSRSGPRTRLGTLGACGLVTLDTGMIAATLLLAPMVVWPMAIAIPASLTRIAVVLSRLSRRAFVG